MPTDSNAFWRCVRKNEDPNVCWPWLKQRDRQGYGRTWFAGKTHGAHRVVFYLIHGHWPLVARHSCDNPPCCNPLHILDGTHADNSADMVERGRSASGDRHVSRLYPERLRRGDRNPSRMHPEKLARGLRHGRYTKPERTPRGDYHWMRMYPEKVLRGENSATARFADAMIEEVKRTPGTTRSLAVRFGMSPTHVSRIKRGLRSGKYSTATKAMTEDT